MQYLRVSNKFVSEIGVTAAAVDCVSVAVDMTLLRLDLFHWSGGVIISCGRAWNSNDYLQLYALLLIQSKCLHARWEESQAWGLVKIEKIQRMDSWQWSTRVLR